MRYNCIIERRLESLIQTVELLMVVLELRDRDQIHQIAEHLKIAVEKYQWIENDDPKWYFYQNGIPKYEATIPDIYELCNIEIDMLSQTRQDYYKSNLRRLKYFFQIIQEDIRLSLKLDPDCK